MKLRKLSNKKAYKIKKYLSYTPIRSLVTMIDPKVKVYAKLLTLKELGETKTIWKDLDGIKNKKGFKVKEAIKVLNSKGYKNDRDKSLIKQYYELFKDEKLEIIITLAKFKKETVIVDGNKRACVFWDYCTKNKLDRKPLVFVIKK